MKTRSYSVSQDGLKQDSILPGFWDISMDHTINILYISESSPGPGVVVHTTNPSTGSTNWWTSSLEEQPT